MRWSLILTLALMLLIAATSGHGKVLAAPGEQGSQPLRDKVILFGTNSGEISPFDTEDSGASRLASILARNGAQIDLVNWQAPIPLDTDLIVIAGPVFNYPADRVARLWAYLESGGSLLLLVDPPTENRSLQANNPMFSLLWTDFGIRATNNLALVPPEGNLPVAPSPDESPQETATPIPTTAPPERIIQLNSANADHPVIEGVNIDNLIFEAVRPLELQSFISTAIVWELLATDDQPYGESDVATYLETGVFQFNEDVDTGRGRVIVAAAAENQARGGRVIVIGNSRIVRNDLGFTTSPPESEAFVYPDVVRFVLNTAFWLLDADPPEFDSPTPQPTATRTITPSPSPTATVPEVPAPGDLATGQPTIDIPLPNATTSAPSN